MTNKEPDISLRADEAVAAGFARIARELLACAIDRIQHPAPDRGEDVHAVRTAIKRRRGMLCLIKPVISETAFDREDTNLRKAARRLALSRDRTIARQALTKLAKSRGNERQREAVAEALAGLDKLIGPEDWVENAMNEVAQDLAQTGRRIQRLRIAGTGWSVLGPGLQAVYRHGRDRMKVAFAKGDEASFHRWRIAVRGIQILAPGLPR